MRKSRKNRKSKKNIIIFTLLVVVIFIGIKSLYFIFGKSDNIVSANGNKSSIVVGFNNGQLFKESNSLEDSEELENNQNNSCISDINQSENSDLDVNNKNKEDNIDSYIVDKSDEVEDSYFDKAVFIGDSRTEGFIMFNKLSNINALTTKGLMVDTVFTKKAINKNGKKMTVSQALSTSNFDKVYIMLGVNELGWVYSDVFIDKYKKIIDYIRQVNRDSIIYIQSIIPVSKKKSDSDKIYNNTNINNYNALIKKMCNDKKVYYVNVREEVVDENGCLPVGASVDGVHLNREYCLKWYNYLKTHTIEQK